MAGLFDKETAHAAVKAYRKGDKKAEDYLGKIILKMYDAKKHTDGWIGYYGEVEDLMRTEALLRMSLGLNTWDEKKSTLYSYLQLICINAFKGVVKNYYYKIDNGRFAKEISLEDMNYAVGDGTVGTVY